MTPVLIVWTGKPNPVVRDVSKGSLPCLADRLSPPRQALPAAVLSPVEGGAMSVIQFTNHSHTVQKGRAGEQKTMRQHRGF